MKIAIWDNGAFNYKGKKEAGEVAAKLITAKTDIYFPFVIWCGDISYRSGILKGKKGKKDFLGPMIKEAGKNRIEVHPVIGFGAAGIGYFDNRRNYRSSAPWSEINKKWKWDKYVLDKWVCPSWEENREKTLKVVKELIDNYDVDGIHLDFMRYPNATEVLVEHPCECEACKRARLICLGKERLSKAELADPGVQFLEAKYRNRFIREFVIAVRAITKPKGLKVSLAARNYLPMASWKAYAVLEGQDWAEWCREGLLDFVCPMTYTTSFKYFQEWLHQYRGLTRNLPVKLYEGIGKGSSMGRLTHAQFIAQIKAARQAGVDGICIFQLNQLSRQDLEKTGMLKN